MMFVGMILADIITAGITAMFHPLLALSPQEKVFR
jgi:hypothetical protein